MSGQTLTDEEIKIHYQSRTEQNRTERQSVIVYGSVAFVSGCRSKMYYGDGNNNNQQSQFHYGTFQGVANHHHPHPVHPNFNPTSPIAGFPHPVPPPTLSPYTYGYQSVPVQGYIAVVEARPVLDRLPCCGLGVGWLLFIAGFFFSAIPWYLGTILLLLVRIDPREKPGYVACVIGAVLVSIALTFGLTAGHYLYGN